MSGLLKILCVGAVCLTGCHRQDAQKGEPPSITGINIKGADSLIQLTTAWEENYKASHPNVKMDASAGGSGTGIDGLLKGTVQIAATIRQLTNTEAAQFVATYGKEPKRTLIGYDAMAVCVHKDNLISSISLDELKRIYSDRDRMEDWRELGANDSEAIVSCGVVPSVVRTVFDEVVFGKGKQDHGPRLGFFGSAELVDGCVAKRGAIGYTRLPFMTDKVKWLNVAREHGGVGVEPTEENIRNSRYPIARPLYLYTLDGAPTEVTAFVAFATGPAGQRQLKTEGFVTISK